MSHRNLRGAFTAAVGSAAVLGLFGLGTPALAADGQPTTLNGTMAQPSVATGGFQTRAPDFWEGSGDLYGSGLAKHPRHLQAFDLNPATTGFLRQTLQNIKAGSVVTVRWDDSPNQYDAAAPATGRYNVSASGGATQELNTLPRTTVGTPWRFTNSYTFTAGTENPVLTFTSLDTGIYGAVVADVRIDQTSAAADTPNPAKPTTNTPDPSRPPIPSGDKPPVGNSNTCVPFSDGSLPTGCVEQTENQQAIDECPPGNASCVAKYATDGAATKQDTAYTAGLVDGIVNKDRYSSPQNAAQQMCGISTQHTSAYTQDQYEYVPGTWNCKGGLSNQDGEQIRPTPGGTLTQLPSS
ncbi:hypothetical protein [Streptomyces albipurpureus]|uniref:Secreted protein n=1 Tax=Streptomyces albipurpureus TaxID=2897419 RepID=A0ABT0UM03_9ACTN|nr:hypothetical protein [Streptomyces sp. CWNU-1]MCM2389652.1 hypothetical protein [Streptomyces sp. CWNU-1]